MSPEEKLQFEKLDREFRELSDLFYRIKLIDRYVFQYPVYFNNGIVIPDGNVVNTGSKIGTKIGNTSDKIGFLGATPIVKQAAITTPSGGATVDSQARAAINNLITLVQNFGFTS